MLYKARHTIGIYGWSVQAEVLFPFPYPVLVSVWTLLHKNTMSALGDFHLTHIAWDKDQIKESCNYRSTYQTFVDIIHDFGLEQILLKSTLSRSFPK